MFDVCAYWKKSPTEMHGELFSSVSNVNNFIITCFGFTLDPILLHKVIESSPQKFLNELVLLVVMLLVSSSLVSAPSCIEKSVSTE
jgi:hypothetical protein